MGVRLESMERCASPRMSLDPLWLQSHNLLRVIERLLPALHVGVCRTPVREEDGAVGVERDGLGVEIDRLGEEAALQCRVPLRLVPLRLVHIRHVGRGAAKSERVQKRD